MTDTPDTDHERARRDADVHCGLNEFSEHANLARCYLDARAEVNRLREGLQRVANMSAPSIHDDDPVRVARRALETP